MKRLFKITLITLVISLVSCSKDLDDNYQQFTCADVFDKYFQYYTNTPSNDTTWWLRLTKDTIYPPLVVPIKIFFVREVTKDIWNTMLQFGQPYPSRYCY